MARSLHIRASDTYFFRNVRFDALVIASENVLIRGNLTAQSNAVVQGNLNIWGNINGVPPKAFIHPHPTDPSQVIRYVAIESAEALTLARGTAKTVNGEAIIALPEHFSMVTSKDVPVTVNLTPEGAPVLLYVKQKSREQIVVAMKQSDFSEFRDVEFSFQVTGARDGFEKMETFVDVGALDVTTPARGDVQKRIDALVERMKIEHEIKAETEMEE